MRRLPLILLLFASTAHADLDYDVDIEVPAIIDVVDTSAPGAAAEVWNDMVLTVGKTVTSVQESPAIVTVIGDQEIRQRGAQTVQELLDTAAGWMRIHGVNANFAQPITRGTPQATLLLRNGMSLHDPGTSAIQTWSSLPIELVHRVEAISGPVGVLWGANSFVGLINVSTRTARDVDGVEVGLSVGDGVGNRQVARNYAIAGVTDVAGTDVLLHVAYETWKGPGFDAPMVLLKGTIPQPNGPALYGPQVRTDQPRSQLVDLNATIERGPWRLDVSYPTASRHLPLGLSGYPALEDLPEDERAADDGALTCPFEAPYFVRGDGCVDKGRATRTHRIDFYDRFATLTYSDQSRSGSSRITLRTSLNEFHRNFANVGVYSPSEIVEGGISFGFDATSYRAAVAADGYHQLGRTLRLNAGVEAFREWLPDRTTASRQGAGAEAIFTGPYDLGRLPLPCPRQRGENGAEEFVPGCPLTALFATERGVVSAYASPRWQPHDRLILEGGARVQAAPAAFGELSYEPQAVFSAAGVVKLSPSWYGKLNYAEGFRPPVFNNARSNGEAIVVGGKRDLAVETSQAVQAGLSARLLRGSRRITELRLRTDFAYTRMNDLIQVVSGQYQNTADRGIYTTESAATLFLTDRNWVQLGYTWMQIHTDDRGRFPSMPENWFNLGTGVQLTRRLFAHTNLRVMGAFEDPNRIIEYRDYGFDGQGDIVNTRTGMVGPLSIDPHEIVMDRIPPSADLTTSMALDLGNIEARASVYNAFAGTFGSPDVFASLEPRLDVLPNPYEGFRFRLDLIYRH